MDAKLRDVLAEVCNTVEDVDAYLADLSVPMENHRLNVGEKMAVLLKNIRRILGE